LWADAAAPSEGGAAGGGSRPAARAHALDRKRQEPIGGGAAPLRIARREMNTDIALGECPEDGVDERVKNDVGVGMPGQSTPMGDAHAAEHDMIAVAEL